MPARFLILPIGIVELDAGKVLDFAVGGEEELLHVEIDAAHAGVIVVERKLRRSLERLLEIGDERIDGAGLEEVRRHDRGGVHAALDGVRAELLHVGERERADVCDEIELALGGLHPRIEHLLALLKGAADAFAGCAGDIDARDLLLDQGLRLFHDERIVDGAIRVERRVGGGDESFEFLHFPFLL